MPFDLSQIETIFVVMMENRSFDHMLGYLSLPEYDRDDVDGLKRGGTEEAPIWPRQFQLAGQYTPFPMPDAHLPLPGDPPHERADIARQLGTSSTDQNGELLFPLDGFVTSFDKTILYKGVPQPVVMGYFNGENLPTNDFFAQNFAICDRWFASLPAGTQPNRLMAMSGQSRIDVNSNGLIPKQELVYDWLDQQGVRWQVYHEGLPFFILMENWWGKILGKKNFSSFSDLEGDIQKAGKDFPQVVFIEPRYTNAPHVDPPHDDHAPTGVYFGQQFLMQVYAIITANPELWRRSAIIVTYDEHGGFFDHVCPLGVKTAAPDGEYEAFTSTGVRVPAFIISPFIEAGTVFHSSMDHTSILHFIGQRFGANQEYNEVVTARLRDNRLSSVAEVFNRETAREEILPPPGVTEGFTTDGAPNDAMSRAFGEAWSKIKHAESDLTQKRFPKLFQHI